MSNEQCFRGVPGVPDGWELVRIGIAMDGEWVIAMNTGEPYRMPQDGCRYQSIVRKIEKPKQYRPFANADEFKPHRDRWWQEKGKGLVIPPSTYGDGYHCGSSWSASFINKLFDDGSPFGVEVTE
jgi:hypothetical protein